MDVERFGLRGAGEIIVGPDVIEAAAAIVRGPIGASIAPPSEQFFRIGFVMARKVSEAAFGDHGF